MTEINPNDSWAQAEVYIDRVYDVTLDSAVVDPVTDEETTQLHLEAPPTHLLITGGYDVSGLPRFSVSTVDAPTDGSQPLVDVANTTVGGPNDLTVYQADGTRLDATPQIGQPEGDNPLSAFGLDASTDVLAGFTEAGGVQPLAAAAPTGAGSGAAAGDGVVEHRRTFPGGGSVTRRFRRGSDGVARLDAIEVVEPRSRATPTTRSLTRMRVARLTLRPVPARDSLRAARRAVRGAVHSDLPPNGLGRTPSETPDGEGGAPTAIVCDPSAGCGDPAPGVPSTPVFYGWAGENCSTYSYCPPSGVPVPNPYCKLFTGPSFCFPPLTPLPPSLPTPAPRVTGLLLQHGILSDAHTWDWMQTWLGQRYGPTVPMAAFSLTSTNSLDAQKAELYSKMLGAGTGLLGQYVVVGHSQGGLIARDIYQTYANSPWPGAGAPVAGVVTIGTPNRGAPIAPNARVLATTLLTTLSGLRSQYCQDVISVITVPGACYAVSRLGTFAQGPLSTLAGSAALRDLQPGSGYLVRRTGAPEKFHRASIASYADPRWVLWRLAAESEPSCAPADPACSGQGLVNQVADVYARLLACQHLGLILRYDAIVATAGRVCGQYAVALDALDQTWYRLTAAPDQATDGVVPGSSQYGFGDTPLPFFGSGGGRQPSRYVVPNGPSHVGETSSRRMYLQLQQILDGEFQVGITR